MRTKIQPQLSQHAIPDGEGFNALPIAFNLPSPLPLSLRARGETKGKKL